MLAPVVPLELGHDDGALSEVGAVAKRSEGRELGAREAAYAVSFSVQFNY